MIQQKIRFRVKCIDYLMSLGMNLKEANATLDSLLYAEKHGISSHGINRITSGFIEKLIGKRLIESNKEPILIDDQGGQIMFDGNSCIGYYGIKVIIEQILNDYSYLDLIFCNTKNLYPTNCLAEYSEIINNHGYICYITSKSPNRVSPPVDLDKKVSKISPIVGTNAYSWGFPDLQGNHVIFDTTMAACTNGALHRPRNVFDDEIFQKNTFITSRCEVAEYPHEIFDSNNNFNGYILPFGYEKNYKGFGNLLTSEFFNFLQEDFRSNSTSIIMIKIKNEDTYYENLSKYKNLYYESLKYADNTGPRLPFDKARELSQKTCDEDIFLKHEKSLNDLPLIGDKGLGYKTIKLDLDQGKHQLNKQSFESLKGNYRVKDSDLSHFKKLIIDKVIDQFCTLVRKQLIDFNPDKEKICEYVYQHEMDTKNFFDNWLNEEYELPKLPEYQLIMQGLGNLQYSKDDAILDLGSGDGAALNSIGIAKTVTCVDISPAMLEKIELKRSSYPFKVETLEADISTYETINKFSKIISVMSLHHLDSEQKPAAIKKCADLLLTDGIMFIGETFLDTNNMACKNNLENIGNMYLRKVCNCLYNNCLSHALKDLQILRRILFKEGEYMISIIDWVRILNANGFKILSSKIVSPYIGYGYIIAQNN